MKNHNFIASRLIRAGIDLSLEVKPVVAAIINFIIVYSYYLLIAQFVPGLFDAFNIVYMFIVSNIIGLSTFHFIIQRPWFFFNTKKYEMEAEALKLEHESIWKTINMITWTFVIIIGTVFVALWVQVLFPMVSQELHSSAPIIRIQSAHAIQIIYLFIGLWFGTIAYLMGYSWEIRKRIAGLG